METYLPVKSVRTGRRLKDGVRVVFLYALCIFWGACFMFPFFWTVSSSLKNPAEIYTFPPPLVPATPRWGNYPRVFQFAPFHRWIVNSFYVTGLTTLGIVISASLVGYSFARFNYRGKDLIFLLTLGTMMLPSQVTLIPQYLLFHRLKWLNSFRPLWVPAWFGGGAFYIFFIRQFIMSLPRDLDEAAVIDGAGYLRIFWSIIVPLCKPVLSTVAVISFIAVWNDFINPLIYLDERDKFTIALGLDALKTAEIGDVSGETTFHILSAACVMAIAPCPALFFAAQRYFVRGIVMSGIKG